MKMNRLIGMFVVLLLMMQACGGVRKVLRKPQLTTSPEKLQLFVDQETDPYTIKVDYTLDIPRGYLPSCARLIYTPAFVSPGYEYTLKPVVVTGNGYNRLEERRQFFSGEHSAPLQVLDLVSDGEAMQIELKDTVPFELWMPESKLIARIVLETCDRQTGLYERVLANGVVYLPQSPGPVMVKYVRREVERKEEGSAYFRYPVNGYIVNPDLFNNRQELDSMNTLIRKVVQDTAAKINRIVITGICSPDGSWVFNENLARKRAEYVRNYLIDHERINPDLIDVKYIAEDWSELRKMVEKSDIANKQAAIQIIDRVSNPDEREAALRRLSNFNEIKERFYLWLRKVTYEIYYTEKETILEVKPE